MLMLTLADFSQLQLGLCRPNEMQNSAQALSCSNFTLLASSAGRHCFGRRSPCSPYLLEAISPSFQSLGWFDLLPTKRGIQLSGTLVTGLWSGDGLVALRLFVCGLWCSLREDSIRTELMCHNISQC